jgi:hypothetical protein
MQMLAENQTINHSFPLFDIVDKEKLQEITHSELEAKCVLYVKKDNPLNLTDKK